MKKFITASLLAIAAISAFATEVTVSGVRDTTGNSVTGSNIAVSQPLTPFLRVSASFENTDGPGTAAVNQYNIGAAYDAAQVSVFKLTALSGIGYYNTDAAKGTFVKFGGQASAAVPYIADTTASVAVVRQLGTSAVNGADHTEGVVGVRYQATKQVSVQGSATYFNDVPGGKYVLGVAYAF